MSSEWLTMLLLLAWAKFLSLNVSAIKRMSNVSRKHTVSLLVELVLRRPGQRDDLSLFSYVLWCCFTILLCVWVVHARLRSIQTYFSDLESVCLCFFVVWTNSTNHHICWIYLSHGYLIDVIWSSHLCMTKKSPTSFVIPHEIPLHKAVELF